MFHPDMNVNVDVQQMIVSDFREAQQDRCGDLSERALFQTVIADVCLARESATSQTHVIMKHRKAWREALGLPPLS